MGLDRQDLLAAEAEHLAVVRSALTLLIYWFDGVIIFIIREMMKLRVEMLLGIDVCEVVLNSRKREDENWESQSLKQAKQKNGKIRH